MAWPPSPHFPSWCNHVLPLMLHTILYYIYIYTIYIIYIYIYYIYNYRKVLHEIFGRNSSVAFFAIAFCLGCDQLVADCGVCVPFSYAHSCVMTSSNLYLPVLCALTWCRKLYIILLSTFSCFVCKRRQAKRIDYSQASGYLYMDANERLC